MRSEILFLMSIVLVRFDYCGQLIKLVSFLSYNLLEVLFFLLVILEEFFEKSIKVYIIYYLVAN